MAVLKAILSEGVLSFIALLVLIGLAAVAGWYLGWDPRTQIAPVVIVLCVLWVLLFIAQRVIAIRRSLRIEAMLKQQNHDLAESVGEQPGAGLLEERFAHALATIKASPHGKTALATMPWYPVIGPPQAGKTTIMRNSTLTFPRIGLEAGNGAPNTAHCDWWLSEQAVFFDTAGRYTTRSEDREEWLRFLSLVAGVRRERPINGVVIVVSIAELLQLDEDAVAAYAQNLRDRYDEVADRFHFVFPVYLLFNKCDLIQGFTDFFGHLDRDARMAPLGYRLPFAQRPPEVALDAALSGFDRLSAHLAATRFDCLAGEHDEAALRSALLFPRQFAMLRPRLRRCLEALFNHRPFSATGILRGIYFTSAHQEGTPIDCLADEMEREYGVRPTPQPLVVPEQRGHFIGEVFRSTIIPDSRLAGFSSAFLARNRRAALGVGMAAALLVAAAMLLTGRSYRANRDLVESISRVGNEVFVVGEQHEQLPEFLARLDAMREHLAMLERRQAEGVPFDHGLGLYKGDDIYRDVRKTYFSEFRQRVLAPVCLRIAQRIDAALNAGATQTLADYRALYDDLLCYRMLTGQARACDAAFMRAMLEGDDLLLHAIVPGDDRALRRRVEPLVAPHLDYWLMRLEHGRSKGEWTLVADADLDRRARERLADTAWVSMVYADVIASASRPDPELMAAQLTNGRIGDLLRIAAPIDRAFTQTGYDATIRAALADRAQQMARRNAVLDTGEQDPAVIERRLTGLYQLQYASEWRKIAASVVIEPFPALARVPDRLVELCGTGSLLAQLYENIGDHQRLRLSAANVQNAPDEMDLWLTPALAAMAQFEVALRDYVANTRAENRIDQVAELSSLIDAFHDCRRDIHKAMGHLSDPAMRDERLGDFLGMLEQTRRSLSRTLVADARALWHEEALVPFAALAVRFPFAANAETSLHPSAFTDFFHPTDGAARRVLDRIDAVRECKIMGRPLLPMLPAYAECSDQLATLGRVFFPEDEQPQVVFACTLSQHVGVEDLSFAATGDPFSLYDRPDRRSSFVWRPGRDRNAHVAVRIAEGVWLHRSIRDDAWSLLRLLDAGTAEALDDYRVRYRWRLTASDLRTEPAMQSVAQEDRGENADADADADRSGAGPSEAPAAAPPIIPQRAFVAELIIEGNEAWHPFRPGVMSGFALPERICVDSATAVTP